MLFSDWFGFILFYKILENFINLYYSALNYCIHNSTPDNQITVSVIILLLLLDLHLFCRHIHESRNNLKDIIFCFTIVYIKTYNKRYKNYSTINN
jgi:hypothetical protein